MTGRRVPHGNGRIDNLNGRGAWATSAHLEKIPRQIGNYGLQKRDKISHVRGTSSKAIKFDEKNMQKRPTDVLEMHL